LPRRQIDESVRDALRRHISLHRPADDTAREQVDHGRHVKPAFGRPDVSEVRDPLLVWAFSVKLAIQDIGRDRSGQAFAFVHWTAAPARPGAHSLGAHQPFDPVRPQETPSASTSRQTRRAP
jgi:hypothetical protein